MSEYATAPRGVAVARALFSRDEATPTRVVRPSRSRASRWICVIQPAPIIARRSSARAFRFAVDPMTVTRLLRGGDPHGLSAGVKLDRIVPHGDADPCLGYAVRGHGVWRSWQRTCFGSTRSSVRVRPPRPP